MSNNLTIGIIGAMDCEVSALKQKLENLEEISSYFNNKGMI